MPESGECLLQGALDRHERCPGSTCPFFEDGECRLQELKADIDTNPQLAGHEGWQPFQRLSTQARR